MSHFSKHKIFKVLTTGIGLAGILAPKVPQLPSPSNLDAIAKAWQQKHEQRTRKLEERTRHKFGKTLPGFQKRIIAELKQTYGQPNKLVIIYEPEAISRRPDLVQSEIVQWLESGGWRADHQWMFFTKSYGLCVWRPEAEIKAIANVIAN